MENVLCKYSSFSSVSYNSVHDIKSVKHQVAVQHCCNEATLSTYYGCNGHCINCAQRSASAHVMTLATDFWSEEIACPTVCSSQISNYSLSLRQHACHFWKPKKKVWMTPLNWTKCVSEEEKIQLLGYNSTFKCYFDSFSHT